MYRCREMASRQATAGNEPYQKFALIVDEATEVHPFILHRLDILNINQMPDHPYTAAGCAGHPGGGDLAPVLCLKHVKPCERYRKAQQFYLVIGILKPRLLKGRHCKLSGLRVKQGAGSLGLPPVYKQVSLPQKQRLALPGEAKSPGTDQNDGLLQTGTNT